MKANIIINLKNIFLNFIMEVEIILVTFSINGRTNGLNTKTILKRNTILIQIRIPKKIKKMTEIIQINRVMKVSNKVIMKK